MTLNRYERGAIPSKSYNDILKRIILDETLFKSVVDEPYKKERISNKTF